jgi:AAA+ ATPase superfamily predicted ATPase
MTTSGNITTTFVYNRQQVTTREEKKKVAVILNRLAKEGLLEPTGIRAGEYRIVDRSCEAEDWQNACTEPISGLWLPFELDQIIEVMPGDIILIAGSQNAGKSALMMNIAKENRDKFVIHYFSSELRPGSFKRRMQKFPDVSPDQMNINFYQRSSNFSDVIKSGQGNLNLIDYIEIHDNFYKISEILSRLHDKLNGALLIAAIQKDPKSLYGRGGSFTQEKPVLSLSLDHGVATISKCKEWREGCENPNKMQYFFKLVDGCRILKSQGWHRPVN